jgi:hypothetical protein
MTHRGTGLIVFGMLMLMGSATAAQGGATPFMNVFNSTLSIMVVLWGVTNRLESSPHA